ncbi:MAG: hypothetical protein Ct9H90mP2_15070 [Dehalococcoidia bacterium]|nr:MAG: hypothetical protein Ct9H90mP2_15070 [Dehalococcoidia bacterium]
MHLRLWRIWKVYRQKLKAFEMNIYAIDPITDQKAGSHESISHPRELNNILEISNWLIIASPLIKDTKNFIKLENLFKNEKK